MKWGLLLIVCSLAVGGLACDQADPESLAGRWNTLRQACKHKDVGAILEIVDRTYQDDLGGVGRLEDDLRQLFLVYGKIDLELFDGRFTEQGLSGRLAVRGRKLEFEGPVSLKFSENLLGKLLVSGFLTDLRGILDTLRQRRLAIEQGSVERLDGVISMEYAASRKKRKALLEQTRASFREAVDTALIVNDIGIFVESQKARVIQTYLMITHINQKTIEHKDHERLMLHKEGTRWRIQNGLG